MYRCILQQLMNVWTSFFSTCMSFGIMSYSCYVLRQKIFDVQYRRMIQLCWTLFMREGHFLSFICQSNPSRLQPSQTLKRWKKRSCFFAPNKKLKLNNTKRKWLRTWKKTLRLTSWLKKKSHHGKRNEKIHRLHRIV